MSLSWTPSTDPESGIAHYSVQQRLAAPDGTLGDWQVLGTTPDASFTTDGFAGATHCFRVAAVNGVGAMSPWSSRWCTSLPRDDDSLTTVGAWQRGTGAGYYLGTFTKGLADGARLKAHVTTKRLALVVKRCPGCGTVRVFFDSEPLKKVSLAATSVSKKVVVPIANFATRSTGTVSVRIVSSGDPVVIDGLGASAI